MHLSFAPTHLYYKTIIMYWYLIHIWLKLQSPEILKLLLIDNL